MSWPMVSFIDVCNIQGGTQPPKSTFIEEEKSGYIRLLQIQDFKRTDKAVFIPYKKTLKTCNEDDILIGRYGASVGKILTGLAGAYNVALVKTLPDLKRLHKNYLYHFLCSPNFQNYISNVGSRAAQAGFNKEDLTNLEIPLPPLAEQKRIVSILNKADAIRRKRQHAIQLADDFLRAVFLDMFGDPVTNPKGFKKSKLTDLADVITGFAFKSAEYVQDSDGPVRLCRGVNTLTGYFEWKDTAFWDSKKLKGLNHYKLESGDVVLAMDRPWISSGLKVCVFPENERDTYLVQRVARIRPKQPGYTDYLYSSILSPAFEKHCCPTETTVPHISPIELKNFEILTPDEGSVKNYHDVVSKLRQSKIGMEMSFTEANQIFNSLSQKAFSGKL
ncbi:MAG: restriction endonuclease subunit S [Gammaproteobacteria bacterium]|nr:restriction endonuclease subunit S [Gammaproteobacteria bacterium]MBU2057137.1 restriction endonuclease subunit S [Gammaproteobacteria bacterium]MBU2175012.1 restriction endonuclease subunit S [Gammaproteobacteria bacterium]MBU2246225.1 restriction endonuclease subunit S [Gammaproteobacteria bacterium]MBU2346108.1 restriction endonuclease subunit S [Gammaproteobacteria bacterium]